MTTETILTDEQLDHCTAFLNEVPYDVQYDLDHIYRACRATEQAVLQSHEIQALRKDAGRYQWLRQRVFEDRIIAAPDRMLFVETLDLNIDAAMEKQS